MRALVRYLARPWFVMDVASTIPFHIMRGKTTGFGFLNLLRLWRLRSVSKMFARFEKDIRVNYFCIRIIKLTCVSTLYCYYACQCRL
jgi:potassium channel